MEMAGKILYLILPIVLGGMSNMIFVKSSILNGLKFPLDGGRELRDGKRIFGDNKTLKGFLGMICLTAFWFQVFYWLPHFFEGARDASLISFHEFSPLEALFYGAAWGFSYVLFELPNSYIKRRLDIAPGKNGAGRSRFLFVFFDQADSVIGCMLMMHIFYRPDWMILFATSCIAVAIHFAMNLLLYSLKLKRQYL